MRNPNWLYTNKSGTLLLSIIVVLSANPASAQDNYLDMLDAYSDDVTNAGQSSDGKADAGKRGTFENQLRRNFKGSYVLYSKLSDASKEEVFKKYQQTGRVADVRSLIVKLYAER